jgi:hypothetical protein
MKITKKNMQPLILVMILSILCGSFAWFIIEIIFTAIGLPFSLGTGRIGFDLEILAIFLNVKPGTVLGIVGGFFVFKAI